MVALWMVTNKQRDTITALRQREICLCATTIDAKSKALTELQHKMCMLSHERYSIHVKLRQANDYGETIE